MGNSGPPVATVADTAAPASDGGRVHGVMFDAPSPNEPFEPGRAGIDPWRGSRGGRASVSVVEVVAEAANRLR